MEVEVNSKETPNNTQRKPSYEELNDYCNQLMMQNRQLGQRLSQVTYIQNKLPWLFKVLENETFFTSNFVNDVANEIKDILTPASEQEQNNED